MNKHTPGPLHVIQLDKWPFNISIVDANGNEIFFDHRHAYGSTQYTVAEVMAGSCFDNQETKAAAIESNARQVADAYLRAAAPDLLAALRDLLKYPAGDYSSHGDFDAAYAAAKAAVSKATGEPA